MKSLKIRLSILVFVYVREGDLMKKLTLKKLLIVYVLLMSLIVFPFLYLELSKIFNSTLEKSARENAESVAKQTFSSMFQIMKKGWSRQDLVEFLSSIKNSQKNYDIEIYRTKIVEDLFGKINQPPFDNDILKTLKEKRSIVNKDGGVLRYTMPLKAKQICLKCHTNAKEGDVLGVVEVKYDLNKFSSSAEKEFSKALLVTIPVPLIVVIVIGYLITQKIKAGLTKLNKTIEDVSELQDFKKIETENINFMFEEFNELFKEIKTIIQKLYDIAVDKEILEFEIRLLEKFILTSDVIKDWKEYIILLLEEINKIIPTYSIFSVFKEEEVYEVEVFWIGRPSDRLRIKVEEILKKKVKEHFNIRQEDVLEIKHNVAEKDQCILNLRDDEIIFQTKALFLEKPQIGGIVGIGIQPGIKEDKTKLLVVESVLSTLLNVVGSVKAIYKYTKDLEYYATRDPLTNLYNQRVFWELASYEVKRAKRHNYEFSLLVIDLDNFKSINDTYGHDFGDKFIVQIANFLVHIIRPGDIAARYGGDEFVIILPETTSEEAYLVAERILESAENFFISAPDGRSLNPMFSIGIATYPTHADNIKDLFSIADTMMYKAKISGKGQVKVPTEEDIVEFLEKENKISVALVEAINDEKVIPYFQPIINLKDNSVEAYEVLSRLEINDEIIPAEEFIEIAEKTGLVFKMDLIVMEKAFQKLQNRDEKIFLNLTPKALIIPDYLLKVRNLVKKYKISPERIVFEITERDTIRNLSLLEKFVLQLKSAGFKFAIDDFGSGFSSFYYVKQLPIDFVKIEGDFIKNLLKDEKDRAFVESIVTLCKKLNIKTVAEFAEEKDIIDEIRKLDIDLAQGYYISEPLRDFEANSSGVSYNN